MLKQNYVKTDLKFIASSIALFFLKKEKIKWTFCVIVLQNTPVFAWNMFTFQNYFFRIYHSFILGKKTLEV